MLPRDVRDDTHKLYRVLRTLDDLVDEDQPQAADRVEAVERWARAEPADTPETTLLKELSRRHVISGAAFLDFCQGMRHDIERRTIHTEDDLERYCQQAGGSVGIMLANMLGTRGDLGEEKMAMLGRAMQRTNILRDIDEDATHGRLYIARTTIDEFGAPTPGSRTELLRNQIARADNLYDRAANATRLLARGQRGMAVSVALYREILRQIEREGFGQQVGRATVPVWRRHLIVATYKLRLPGLRAPIHP
jgi:phytoene synthase